MSVECFATVRILTFHYNQPNFIRLQYKTLSKFLQDDFELIVFNDAKTIQNEAGIENVCQELGIKCVRFQPEWHLIDPLNDYLHERLQEPSTIGNWDWNQSTTIEEIANHPSVRHCHVIQYALDHYGYDHNDIVVLMDGDNFLIKPLSIRALLGKYDIIGFNQQEDVEARARKKFRMNVPKNSEKLWVVFIAFNPTKLPNPYELQFHVDVVNDISRFPDNSIQDTGSAIYKYLAKYPHLKITAYPWLNSCVFRENFTQHELLGLGFEECLINFIDNIKPANVQFFLFEHFIHFSAVSFETNDHTLKAFYLQNYLNNITVM